MGDRRGLCAVRMGRRGVVVLTLMTTLRVKKYLKHEIWNVICVCVRWTCGGALVALSVLKASASLSHEDMAKGHQAGRARDQSRLKR